MATLSGILAWRNPMGRGAWRAAVHGVAKSQLQLSTFIFTFIYTNIYSMDIHRFYIYII